MARSVGHFNRRGAVSVPIMVFSSDHSSAGSTLIEVLVATLILGIGLLGFAATQTQSLMLAREAHWQLQASLLAQSLAEQMRAVGPPPLPRQRRAQWQERLEQQLPNAEVVIEAAAGERAEIEIRLRWQGAVSGQTHQLNHVFWL